MKLKGRRFAIPSFKPPVRNLALFALPILGSA